MNRHYLRELYQLPCNKRHGNSSLLQFQLRILELISFRCNT